MEVNVKKPGKGHIMSKKDVYIEKLKAQLDEWSVEIDHLEGQLRKTDAELRAKYESHIAALKVKREEARGKLAELQHSAGDAWLELQKGADEAWEAIKKAVAEARKKF